MNGEAALVGEDMFASTPNEAEGGEVYPHSPDKRRYVKASSGVVDEGHKGRLIVLEGLDGSGKETQAGLLRASLIERGVDLRSVSFPRYDSASSALVRMYLGGQFGSKADDVNAFAASTFYAADRYASYKSDWKAFHEAGGVVLADRYTTSNAVHQCAKLPREEWDSYLDWLFDFEYNLLGIPEPDLVAYLRVDPDVSRKLLDGRAGNGDIHEQDAEYLARCREAADHCAKRCGWTVLECSPDKTMRSIEDIHGELLELVECDNG